MCLEPDRWELRPSELALHFFFFFINFQLMFTIRRREVSLPQNSRTCLSNLARQMILRET